MDILYKLPFPKEVCSKIFMYACKSRHCDLGSGMVKKILGLSFYKEYCIDKRGHKRIGMDFYDRNVVELNSGLWYNKKKRKLDLGYEKLNFDIKYLYILPKLIWLYLSETRVYGDIAHLNSLQDLMTIDLSNTDVSGDIIHLKSLYNLENIILDKTGVTGNIVHLNSLLDLQLIALSYTSVNGNIAHLNSLLNLQVINLDNTGVTGDIIDLKSLPNLDVMRLENTSIKVDEDNFNEYRKSVGLDECEILTKDC